MIESQLLKILLRRIGVIVVLISIGYFYGNDVSLFLTDSLNFATNFSLIIKISIMFGSNIRRWKEDTYFGHSFCIKQRKDKYFNLVLVWN